MGLTNDKESWGTFHPGNKVSYQLNDDKLRTGTIISIGSLAKIKGLNTKMIRFVPLKNVRHFRF